MPGRPKLKKLCAKIEEEGGVAIIYDLVAQGYLLREVGEAYETSRGMIYSALRMMDRDGYQAALAKAREDGAHMLAEEGLEILDDATPDDIQVAKERAQYRRWMAGMHNKKAYGEKKEGVVLNINALHFDALQKAGTPESIPVVEAVELPALPEGETDEA
jgi:transposase